MGGIVGFLACWTSVLQNLSTQESQCGPSHGYGQTIYRTRTQVDGQECIKDLLNDVKQKSFNLDLHNSKLASKLASTNCSVRRWREKALEKRDGWWRSLSLCVLHRSQHGGGILTS
eukprot:543255-Amphidinium_carterae.1